jgi:hypothetical protein
MGRSEDAQGRQTLENLCNFFLVEADGEQPQHKASSKQLGLVVTDL